jgi:manganese/zinc/iron transport system ATP- binding protein
MDPKTNENCALRIDQLTVNYDKTPVLWEISCSFSDSQIVGIIGPNGAGKSTFLKAVLGLIKPISGTVQVYGKTLAEQRQRVAYVPQRESVDWDFPISVLELVLMGCYGRLGLFRRPSRSDRQCAKDMLELLGISEYADRQISQLSGGQQQRVFIARALLQDADIYFMDEPFSGVDMATERMLMEQLHELKRKGKTIFVVHHDLNSVKSYFDSLMVLNMRLVALGPVDQVFTADVINSAYGKNSAFFGEAFRLAQNQSAGIV